MEMVTEIQRYLAAGYGEPYVRALLARALDALQRGVSEPRRRAPEEPPPDTVVATRRLWEGR